MTVQKHFLLLSLPPQLLHTTFAWLQGHTTAHKAVVGIVLYLLYYHLEGAMMSMCCRDQHTLYMHFRSLPPPLLPTCTFEGSCVHIKHSGHG